jgi:hypothetical protein
MPPQEQALVCWATARCSLLLVSTANN